MRTAQDTLNEQFLEMRWRCLSLAADLDRIERAAGGAGLPMNDSRLQLLHESIRVLLQPGPNRAERIQTIFSDQSPPPPR